MDNNLKKLEFDKILDNLSKYCKTYIGKKYVSELRPSQDKETVQKTLAETSQGVILIQRNSTPPLGEIADITVYLKTLDGCGSLSIKALLELQNILQMAESLKNYLAKDFLETSDFSAIKQYFEELYINPSIVATLAKSIVDEDTIADSASAKLQDIRRKERKIEQDIRSKLNTILHSATYSKYMRENLVTIRNGRFVIPVKEEYRSCVKGFVHDMSSSGSTVFIEPISVFDFNNELSNLHIEEELEIERILQNLSGLLFPYTKELENDVKLIGKLDFIFAKAHYSLEMKCNMPEINDDKIINLKNARHPLIDQSKVVPISLELGKEFSSLIITGPNTGGKTVSLKTIGLLSAMACSGLNIPADEHSSIYVFDHIFADIGDEQSISESLSTFSSHISNIVKITQTATADSLILVDELGSGTDPLEGAHLAISRKLGLDEKIIEKASAMIDKETVNLEDLLKNIYDQKSEIENVKQRTTIALQEAEELQKSLKNQHFDVSSKEKEMIANAKQEAKQILIKAKETANSIIREMDSTNSASKANKLRNKLNDKITSLTTEKEDIELPENLLPSIKRAAIKPGLDVHVKNLDADGTVVSNISKDDTVQVQIGIMKMKVDIKELQEAKSKKSNNVKVEKSARSSFKAQTVKPEINVLGLTVDEAVPLIDKYIDDCFVAKLSPIRIVHGKGTGALRNGIHRYLKTNKTVDNFRLGTFGEGEMGVTIVNLKIK